MADIDDLLGSGELDYDQDFGEQDLGEANDSEDEQMEVGEDEEEDVLGFGKDEVLYEYDELELPQQHKSIEKELKDGDGKSDTEEEEITKDFVEHVSKEDKCDIEYYDPALSPHPPPDDGYDEVDEPQSALSPLPPPDCDDNDNEPLDTSIVQQKGDNDSTADQLLAAVLEGLDDQEEENKEQKDNNFEKNEVYSCEDEDDDDNAEEEDDDDEEAEGKRRKRSRFKNERTKLSFNTLVEEKKDIVDSLESIQVPQSEKGNLISFTIPKVKPQGLMEPEPKESMEPESKDDMIQEPASDKIDEVSLQLLGYMQQSQPEKDDSSDDEKLSEDECKDDVEDDDDEENSEPRQRFRTERAVTSLTEGTRKSISISESNVKRVIPDSLDMVKIDLATSSGTTMTPGSIHEKFVVPSNRIGSVIGKGGENIRKICAASGAQIDLDRNNPSEKAFNIMGLPMQVYEAKVMISRQAQMNIEIPRPKIENNSDGVKEKTVENTINVNITTGGIGLTGVSTGVSIEKFTIPFNKAGLVIGKGGENIKKIIIQTKAQIQLDKSNTTEKVFTIKGDPMQRYNAKVRIAEAAQMKDVIIPKPTVNLGSNLKSNDLQQSSFQNPVTGMSSTVGINNYLVTPSSNYPLQLPGGITYGSYTGVGYSNYNQSYSNYNQGYGNYNQGYSNYSQGYGNYNQFSMGVQNINASSHTSSPQLSNMGYSPYQGVAVGSNNRGTSYQMTQANNYAMSTSYQTTQANNFALNQTYSSQAAASPSVNNASTSSSTSNDVRNIIEKARLQKVENFLKKIDDQNKNDVRSIIETSRLKKVGNILKTLDDQEDVQGSYSRSYPRNHSRSRSRSRSRERDYYY